MRAWERVFRRAGVRLAFSQGFRPHAKMVFASALPVGVTGSAELLDLTLSEDTSAETLTSTITCQLPRGLSLVDIAPLEGPSLPSRVRYAVYRARVEQRLTLEDTSARLAATLAATALPRTRLREKKTLHYDLRPLIDDLWLESWDVEQVIGMRLRSDHAGAGRPDEVLAALDLLESRATIDRVGLVLEDSSRSTALPEPL
ncbi:MAG: TIGR03936 family radical SAM-associated protein [Chloroflexi bacterium]|nr:TIGR03936 family radical SAM-associated protein [Chloroflexota bacterium]